MKFDAIILNPPYTNTLHMRFLKKILSFVEDSSYVIQISPNILLAQYINSNHYEYMKVLENNLQNIDILDHKEANKSFIFRDVISELAIYTVKKNTEQPIDIYMYGFDSQIHIQVFDKITRKREGKIRWDITNDKYIKYRKDYNGEKYFVNLYIWKKNKDAYSTCINEKGKYTDRSIIVCFDTKNQEINFRNSLKTDFAEFFIKEIVIPLGGRLNRFFLFNKYVYNSPVTNDTFFKFFELNEEEQKYILDTVKKYV